MSTLDQAFNTETFNIEPTLEVLPAVSSNANDTSSNLDEDYERARNNLHMLLTQGQEALNHALNVAKQSESARAFEVVGDLVQQLAAVNHQLLDLTEKKRKLSVDQGGPKTVNNNAYFVGSTAELKKMLHDLKTGE